MKIRHLTESDVEAVARLGLTAFPTTTYEERVRGLTANPRCALSDFFLAEENGSVAGTYAVYPFIQSLRGADLRMGGIASVAVAPEWRRRGVGGEMMLAAIAEMKRRGYVTSVLYPFEYGFYRRYGWATAAVSHVYSFAPAALPVVGDPHRLRRLDAGEMIELCTWHEKVWRTRNGALKRPITHWKALLGSKLENVYLFRGAEGRIEGYLAFRFLHTADPLKQELEVLEMLATTDEAWRSLVGFFALQRSQVTAVRLAAAPDEPLLALVGDPRSVDYRSFECGHFSAGYLGVSWMLRVLDVDGLLGAGMVFNGPDVDVAFELTDLSVSLGAPVCRVVSFRGGKAAGAEAIEPEQVAGCERRFACGIGEFAQLLTGFLRPSNALRIGAATADSPATAALLDEVFRYPETPFISPIDSF